MNKTLNNERGFTLLEILIAATVLAVMGLSIITITNNSIDNKEKVLAEDKTALQLELAMNVFQNDFYQIYSPLLFAERDKKRSTDDTGFNKYDSNDHFSFSNALGHPVPRYRTLDKTGFEFFTASNRRRVMESKESNFAWVRYSLRPFVKDPGDTEEVDENKPQIRPGSFEWVRTYEAANPYSPEASVMDEARPNVLLRNVLAVEWMFWDPKEKKFVENIEDAKSGTNILRAVMIKLTWVDETNTEVKEQRIFTSSWPPFEEKKKTTNPNPSSGETF